MWAGGCWRRSCSTLTGSSRPSNNARGDLGWAVGTLSQSPPLGGLPSKTLGRYTSVQRVAGSGVWWQPVSPGEDSSGDAALRVQGMACSSKEALGCVTWGCS